MITALHMRTDGSYELFEYDPLNGLDELNTRVGGWIEVAPAMDREITLYCNEEGKIMGLPHNEAASIMLGPNNPDWIAGDAVVVGAPDSEGNDTDLPTRYRDALKGES